MPSVVLKSGEPVRIEGVDVTIREFAPGYVVLSTPADADVAIVDRDFESRLARPPVPQLRRLAIRVQ